jgi:hypothetical protein
MVPQQPEIKHQSERRRMSAITHIGQAKGLVKGLEKRERARNGGTLTDARARIARAMGVMPGTLFNLVYDRAKRIDENLRARLSAYAVADIEKEIAGLRHELAIASEMGEAPDAASVRRLEAVIADASALLSEMTGGRP